MIRSGAVKLSARASRISESATLRVTRRAAELRAQGVAVVDLGAGEPDFSSPACAVEAARRALAEGFTRYTPGSGLPELRAAVADSYRARYGAPWKAPTVGHHRRRQGGPLRAGPRPLRGRPGGGPPLALLGQLPRADPVRRRHARHRPHRGRRRLPHPRRTPARRGDRPHPGHPHQLAVQPHGRDRHRRRSAADRGRRRRARPAGDLRRDLRAVRLRRVRTPASPRWPPSSRRPWCWWAPSPRPTP